MTTSTISPEEFGIAQQDDAATTSESGSKRGMSDNVLISRPLKRAIKGFMSLLHGGIDAGGSIAPQQEFFEKLKNCKPNSDTHGFNRFQRALRRVRYSSEFKPTRTDASPLGLFAGRPVIGESTRINGGVYVGTVAQEVIVVDDKHGGLERIYKELVVRLSEISIDRTLQEKEILPEIAALAVKHLRFDEHALDSICAREGIAPDDKVAIDMFLYEGVGVARHQVLVVAYLIERLKQRNLLHGCASIDAMSTHLMGRDERLTYTSPTGYLFVFDPVKLRDA